MKLYSLALMLCAVATAQTPATKPTPNSTSGAASGNLSNGWAVDVCVGKSEADILIDAIMTLKVVKECAAKHWPSTPTCEGTALAIAHQITDVAAPKPAERGK